MYAYPFTFISCGIFNFSYPVLYYQFYHLLMNADNISISIATSNIRALQFLFFSLGAF